MEQVSEHTSVCILLLKLAQCVHAISNTDLFLPSCHDQNFCQRFYNANSYLNILVEHLKLISNPTQKIVTTSFATKSLRPYELNCHLQVSKASTLYLRRKRTNLRIPKHQVFLRNPLWWKKGITGIKIIDGHRCRISTFKRRKNDRKCKLLLLFLWLHFCDKQLEN